MPGSGRCADRWKSHTGGRGPLQSGTLTTIDTVAMNFSCHGKTGDRLYWVARETRFRAGRANASFFDLRTGRPVNVTSHRSGDLVIADLVVL